MEDENNVVDIYDENFEKTEEILMKKITEAETPEDAKKYADSLTGLMNARLQAQLGYAKLEAEANLSRERMESEMDFNREKLEKELEDKERDRKAKHPVLGIFVGAVATVGAGAAGYVIKGVFDDAWLKKVEKIEKTENIALNTKKYIRKN